MSDEGDDSRSFPGRVPEVTKSFGRLQCTIVYEIEVNITNKEDVQCEFIPSTQPLF